MRHLFISTLFAVALVLSGSLGVFAQDSTVPTPQTLGSIVTDRESSILQGFFEKLNEAAQSDPESDTGPTIGDIVTDVIKTVGAESSDDDTEDSDESDKDNDDDNSSDAESEDDEDEEKGKGKNKNKGKGKNKNKDKDAGKNKKKDKSKGRGKGLPPGLQKQLSEKGELPPGLQKKLRETGALPPGLQASGLPEELEAELPDLPEGQQRVIVDNDVLIIEEVTGKVLDAIPDIIPPDLAPILNQLPTILQQQ